MKKIAIYCRVSSDDQKERGTIENQVETLDTYVSIKDDLIIYKRYLDDGISGTIPLTNRPAGADLIKDASVGLFDAVLVWKVDRFGRDTLTGLQAVEELRKYNVEIISMSEPFDLNTPSGRFQFTMYLNMAELERNNILDRMYLGATIAAKKGKWLGGIVPYGYNVDKDGYLEIKEDEAVIIKKIFDLYTEDKLSSLKIAAYLVAQGIPSSCGTGKGKRTKNVSGRWNVSSIQRILKSTTYKGIHEYGKRGTRRTETILRDVPAIITEEQWNKAAELRSKNQIDSMRNTTGRDYLLRLKIKCELCGGTFYGISYKDRTDVYCCSGKKSTRKIIDGIKCDNANIPADMIEEEVWKECKDILTNYESYLDDFSTKKEEKDEVNNLDNLKKLLSSKNAEKNNILTLYRKGIIDDEELEEQLLDIKKEEKKLKDLISILEEKNKTIESRNNLFQDTISKLDHYRNRLSNLTFNDKKEIINLLVKEIKVNYEIAGGKKIPRIEAIFNLVKLDIHTDMGLNSKFDIIKNEFLPIYIGTESIGQKLSNLRLRNNVSRIQLSKELGFSDYKLKQLEEDKLKNLYYYAHIYCRFFSIDPVEYLDFKNLPEDTTREKITKLKALFGYRTHRDVAKDLKICYRTFTRYLKDDTNKLDSLLDTKLKERYP